MAGRKIRKFDYRKFADWKFKSVERFPNLMANLGLECGSQSVRGLH
jgi:hypothetical protein